MWICSEYVDRVRQQSSVVIRSLTRSSFFPTALILVFKYISNSLFFKLTFVTSLHSTSYPESTAYVYPSHQLNNQYVKNHHK